MHLVSRSIELRIPDVTLYDGRSAREIILIPATLGIINSIKNYTADRVGAKVILVKAKAWYHRR